MRADAEEDEKESGEHADEEDYDHDVEFQVQELSFGGELVRERCVGGIATDRHCFRRASTVRRLRLEFEIGERERLGVFVERKCLKLKLS